MRAAHGHPFDAGFADVGHAHVRDALCAGDVGNRRPAPAAATAGTEPRTLHFLNLKPQCTQHLTRGLVFAVVAAQVTRVVVGHAASGVRFKLKQPALDQLGHVGAVVLHPVITAQGAVFVFQHVKAVGVAGDDAAEGVLRQGLDIARGQRLKRGFVAQTPGHVATVAFFKPQDGEINTRRLQDADKSAQGALIAHVERAVTDPKQHVRRTLVAHQRQVQIGGPVHAPARCEPAGVVRGDQVVQHLRTGIGRGAFFQREKAPHVDDGVHVLDHHRALFDTGSAGGAGPQRVSVHQAVDDGLMRSAPVLTEGLAGVRAACKVSIGAPRHAHHHVLNQLLRVQRLACRKGRARGFALAALHTGVKPQELVPGEVFRFFYAQRGAAIGQVQGFQTGGAPAAKSLGAAVPGQVQGASKRMLHRPAPGHAEEQFAHAPDHAHNQQRGQRPAPKAFRQHPRHGQGQDEKTRGKHQQAFRQAHPRAFGQTARRVEATFEDKQRPHTHQRRGTQQGVGEDALMHAHPMNQNRQHRRQHKAARRGHVGVGHVAVAGHDVVQVVHVALGHGQQAAQQIDAGRAALPPEVDSP